MAAWDCDTYMGSQSLKLAAFAPLISWPFCDLQSSAAYHVASAAEKGLGARPKVYTNYDEMLEKEKDLDAVNIVTDTRFHHIYALKAFEEGMHVAVEKPMAVTVRAARRMVEGAQCSGRVLSVGQNYRRDPMQRVVKALLEAKAIGEPRLALYVSTGGGRFIQHIAAWRHMKPRGGYVVEWGVHHTDKFLNHMGDVDRVYAETHLWEKVRYAPKQPLSGTMAKLYSHRVKEEIERSEAVETTADDMALAVLRFRSGAMGQISMSQATPGESTGTDIIYGSEGSLAIPSWATGRPVQLTLAGSEGPLGEKEMLDMAPLYQLDDVTAAFFDGRRRLSSYSMPFEQIDRIMIAIELQDFAESILTGREPEVPGEVGLKAVALSYAILESGQLGEPVSLADVVEDRVNGYQQEINESVGL